MSKERELNNLFSSDDYKHVLEFYNKFKDREALIQWGVNRQNSPANIHIVNGNSEIVIIIPTANYKGEYARRCREIFKGFKIVFVDSGGINPYFRYSRNCNIGIKAALKYQSKWIIVANDDLKQIDDLSLLRSELQKIDNKNIKAVFSTGFSNRAYLFARRRFTKLFYIIKSRVMAKRQGLTPNEYMMIYKRYLNLCKKFKVIYFPMPHKFLNRLFFKKVQPLLANDFFWILSSEFCNKLKGKVFDETFLFDCEDADLSLCIKPKERTVITFRIAPRYKFGGGTAGKTLSREFRSLYGLICLNKFYQQGKYTQI